MSQYNPKIHKRKSIRLKGYDYSKGGLFFITICTQNKANLFGEIKNGIMELNNAGKMIDKWYRELENKFPDVKCHAHIVMPNHFHCIVENAVGADLCVCPQSPASNPIPECPSTSNKQTISHDVNPSSELYSSNNIESNSDGIHKIPLSNELNSMWDSSYANVVFPVGNYDERVLGDTQRAQRIMG